MKSIFFITIFVLWNNVVATSDRKSRRACEAYISHTHTYEQNDEVNWRKPPNFPYVAAIIYINYGQKYETRCSGALISTKFVVVPAHCAGLLSPYELETQISHVRLGTNKSFRHFDHIDSTTDYEVLSSIVHPNFSRTSYANDIALLELKHEVLLSDTIIPACLFSDNKLATEKLTLVEWRPENSNIKNNMSIHETSVNSVVFRCELKNSAKYSIPVHTDQVCVEDTSPNDCLSNIRGPLQLLDGNVFSLVGIPSHGDLCGTSENPYIYTSIKAHIDWITEHVWP